MSGRTTIKALDSRQMDERIEENAEEQLELNIKAATKRIEKTLRRFPELLQVSKAERSSAVLQFMSCIKAKDDPYRYSKVRRTAKVMGLERFVSDLDLVM